uniref:non-specific serine/threonine protein kinase n=1 Tax=Oryza punctata TaxID=4537 RepID=A0A0E0L4M2_ORYPU
MAGTPPSSRDPSPQHRRPLSSSASAAALAAAAKPRGGLLLGRYELGRLLGHGTFAKVYQARNAESGETVAIKVLDKEKALRHGLVPHIKREIAILRRVRHPNIVRLFEVMATKSKIYFVMELVRGGELFARVAKGRLKEDTARRYFQQLVSAVGFCHARGVFHRDLKPENLLVDEHGDLKVSDFGLSAVADQFHPDGLLHTFCGTPSYVAPEVLARRGYDGAKADIWSCGVILFVLMAGYLPFHDQNLMAMYRKIYRGEFRCPRWFSKDLTSLLNRILDTNPETRITVKEVMESRWFQKGFRPVRFYVEDDQVHSLADGDNDMPELEPREPPPPPLPPPPQQDDDGEESGWESDSSVASCPATLSSEECRRRPLGSLTRPASLNAFDIISFSRGFDLSGLFEERGSEVRFVSAEPMQTIITKLEEIAKVKSFFVRRKDWRVSIEGTREGEKGPLTIGAEIFELTPSLVVVEVKKKAGDKEEYDDFCNRELKPGMQHLVHHMGSVPNIPSDTE